MCDSVRKFKTCQIFFFVFFCYLNPKMEFSLGIVVCFPLLWLTYDIIMLSSTRYDGQYAMITSECRGSFPPGVDGMSLSRSSLSEGHWRNICGLMIPGDDEMYSQNINKWEFFDNRKGMRIGMGIGRVSIMVLI